MPQLSVIISVYNEAKTIKQILEKIKSIAIDKEIIVVDDGSTDGTDRILGQIKFNNLKVIHHSSNRGKGAAFLTGLADATGEYVIIQDADLEYEPNDYFRLLAAIKETKADIVLGARFKKGYRGLFLHRLGNRFLTSFLNLLFTTRLNDYSTCYKLARKDAWVNLNLESSGFDIDVEIICRAIKRNKQLLEIPISYHPRTYKEGKKIRWVDGIGALISIIKYRFLK